MKKLVALLLISGVPLFAQDKAMEGIHLHMGLDTPPHWERSKENIRIFDELSRRLGFTYDYENYPASRLNFLVERGAVDGQFMKTYGYGESQPNLVRLPTSYFTQTIQAYSQSFGIQVNSWSDLEHYSLVIMRGIQAFDSPLSTYLPEKEVIELKDIKSCVQFVESGRAQVTLLSDFLAEQMRIDSDFDLHLAGDLNEHDMYFYLHRSFEEYIPLMDAALNDMMAEGFFTPKN
ncbi:MAG: hypothetical protein PQJ59_04005 [Spirochaetales bacterium]|nr:hypothetical protein [Spirochaetales bacterium]